MLHLQRTAGNHHVVKLLRRSAGEESASPTAPVVQRGEESQALLAKMAVPQTFELTGGEVDLQDSLVTSLDAAIDREPDRAKQQIAQLKVAWQAEADRKGADNARMEDLNRQIFQLEANLRTYNDATFIGAIVLESAADDVDGLKANAHLVDLPSDIMRQAPLRHSLQGGAFHLVAENGLSGAVVANTLTTMERAGQLEYLVKAGLPNTQHKIVIEVHYYRDRPASSTQLHKDTRGETLFVNLSFNNKQRILGPEYIVNPASSQVYDQFVRQKLPEVFVDDLEAFKRQARGDKFIEATVLEANGVVAFVDEAIHHKTPTPGPRTATADRIPTALALLYGDEYADAARAYREYKNARWYSLWTFGSYFKDPVARQHSGDWWKLLDKLEGKPQPLTRDTLTGWLPDHFKARAEEILEQSATDFTRVSLAVDGGRRVVVPVRGRDEAPLKRRMSMEDLSAHRAPAGSKRSFFRTWVRAVPK